MNEFDPNGPGMPRIEHAVVDEQQQMQQYLAEIAMEDLRLLPDPSRRRVRKGSLLHQYQVSAAAEHAQEAANDLAQVKEFGSASVPAAGVQPDDKQAKGFGE